MQFSFEHIVPLARERVFAFHENPARMELLHADSQVRVLAHEPQLRVGAETWIEVIFAGFIPVVFGVRHMLFEPPIRFGEEIFHGPFSKFTHIHEFDQVSGGTRIRDWLDVRLPWQYGGNQTMRYFMRSYLAQMFRRRGEAMDGLISSGIMQSLTLSPVH